MNWYMETEMSAKGVTVCVEVGSQQPVFEEKHKMPRDDDDDRYSMSSLFTA
jgi:hypothetical protein